MEIDSKAVKLVIFDLDDTLVDNREVDYHSFVDVAPISRRQLLNLRKQGLKAEEIWTKLAIKRQGLMQSGHLWLKYAKLFPGVTQILKKLVAKNIRVGIVTIREKKGLVLKLLKKLGIASYFDYVYCQDKYKGYQKTLEKFGVKPQNALVVGDDLRDLEIALSLGMSCLRVYNPYKLTQFKNQDFPRIKRISDLGHLL